MSYFTAEEPTCTGRTGAIELTIAGRQRDLGGFAVRRVLPARERRMVGPFVFFDHMGPAEFPPGQGIQVRPHPHIGLATITYLFAGEIVHRDSLGCVQPIEPGAVNLMTAGRGIVHSERAGDDLEQRSHLDGIQSWIALPADQEEREPAFTNYPSAVIPETTVGDAQVRVIMGTAWGLTSPVICYSPTMYAECRLPAQAALELPDGYPELAVYVVAGALRIGHDTCGAGVMAVLAAGRPARINVETDAHVMIIGGEPLGPRHIWWNFVSTSPARIEQAKADWKAGRFAAVPGDDELIPLPA